MVMAMGEEYDAVNQVVFAVVSWTTLFLFIRKIFSKRSVGFCTRIVSTIHAISAVILASLSVEDWSCPVCPLASASSPKQGQALAATLGYFIYDLICCFLVGGSSFDDSFHHLVCIAAIASGFAFGKCGSEQVATLFILESSTPFLHARELLKEVGYRDTNLNLALDITFALIFSVGRMVGGSYLLFVTVSANNPIVIKVMAVGLQLVSAFWFYKIVKMLTYKLTKTRKVGLASTSLQNEKLD